MGLKQLHSSPTMRVVEWLWSAAMTLFHSFPSPRRGEEVRWEEHRRATQYGSTAWQSFPTHTHTLNGFSSFAAEPSFNIQHRRHRLIFFNLPTAFERRIFLLSLPPLISNLSPPHFSIEVPSPIVGCVHLRPIDGSKLKVTVCQSWWE